jgi:hypothetical protein
MPASSNKRNQPGPRFVAVIIGAVVFVAVIILARTLGRSDNEAAIREGVAYLQTLEGGDTADIETAIADQRRKRMNEERELRLTQLTNGSIDVWSLFGDSVILGDSRSVGFSFYEFLPEERVLASTGDSISNIAEHVDALKTLNPSLVFICYGMNDIGMWADIDDFTDNYRSILRDLQNELPNAQLFVNSIFPVDSSVEASEPLWGQIPDYNSALRAMCETEGYGFVDGDKVMSAHGSLFDVDGVHFLMDFYPYWAAEMMMTVYDSQAGTDGSASETAEAGESSGEAASEEAQDGEAADGADGE